MMDISKMTDQEKSVLLAKARGWVQQVGMVWYWKDNHTDYVIGSPKNLGTQIPNLYDPENMALAKQVILWGYCTISAAKKYLELYAIAVLLDEDGFNKALDKILELCLEDEIEKVNDAEKSTTKAH